MGKLVGYDFSINYRPGKQNKAADALSRSPDAGVLYAVSKRTFEWLSELLEANKVHPELLVIQQGMVNERAAYTDYSHRKGLLFYKNRLVIPRDSSLKQVLLKEFHDSKIGGRARVARTFHRLSSNFYWPAMHRDVKIYIGSCHFCQRSKNVNRLPAGLLQPLPIPEMAFEEIAMDFITCLPSSTRKATIMIVVDRLSKYGHFIPLPATFTAQSMAEAFVVHIIKLHGPPRIIVTDHDPRFLHDFWQEIHRLQGTILAMSTVYHPQTDG